MVESKFLRSEIVSVSDATLTRTVWPENGGSPSSVTKTDTWQGPAFWLRKSASGTSSEPSVFRRLESGSSSTGGGGFPLGGRA